MLLVPAMAANAEALAHPGEDHDLLVRPLPCMHAARRTAPMHAAHAQPGRARPARRTGHSASAPPVRARCMHARGRRPRRGVTCAAAAGARGRDHPGLRRAVRAAQRLPGQPHEPLAGRRVAARGRRALHPRLHPPRPPLRRRAPAHRRRLRPPRRAARHLLPVRALLACMPRTLLAALLAALCRCAASACARTHAVRRPPHRALRCRNITNRRILAAPASLDAIAASLHRCHNSALMAGVLAHPADALTAASPPPPRRATAPAARPPRARPRPAPPWPARATSPPPRTPSSRPCSSS